jgi:hypothetical protein
LVVQANSNVYIDLYAHDRINTNKSPDFLRGETGFAAALTRCLSLGVTALFVSRSWWFRPRLVYRGLVSVSDHLQGRVAKQVRTKSGDGLGTPLPYNLNVPGCRQRWRSPVGDIASADQQALVGPL